MQKQWDYEAHDKLSVILADKKLVTRYGGRYGKYLTIHCGRMDYWKVNRAALEFFITKFGDVTFSEAIKKWREQN